MKNKKKSTAIILSLLFSVLLLFFISSKIFFYFIGDNYHPEKTVTTFCKNALGKAVKFEDISFNAFGNIKLHSFNLSAGPDFNDNLSLIQANEAIFDLDFFSLLKGRPKIRGISLSGATILIHKSFGESHRETFRDLFFPKDLSLIKPDKERSLFRLCIKNSRVIFEERFKDGDTRIVIQKFGGKLNWYDTFYTLQGEGEILPGPKSMLQEGEIDIKARISFPDKEKSFINLRVERFDTAFFNQYLSGFEISDSRLSGGISLNLRYTRKGNQLSMEGDISTISLNLTHGGGKAGKIISNANIDLSFSGTTDKEWNKIALKKALLKNDTLRVTAGGSLDTKKKHIKFRCKSNDIRLDTLWQNFSPLANATYGGLLKFHCDWDIDLKKEKTKKLITEIDLKKFTLNRLVKSENINIISRGNLNLKSKKDKIKLSGSYRVINSDFNVRLSTDLKKIWPFTGKTGIRITSKKLEGSLLSSVVATSIEHILAEAYEDKKTGYYKSSFLKKESAQFLKRNEINFGMTASEVTWGNKTSFRNLKLEMENRKGIIRNTDFNLDGYGGDYRLEVNMYFNSDRPFIKIKGKAGNVKLPLITSSPGTPEKDGLFNLDFDYEVSAFRFSQILENSKGNIFLAVRKGRLNDRTLNKALISLCKKNNLPVPVNELFQLNAIDVTLSQVGEHFFFRILRLNSPVLNLEGYGSWLYEKGLNVPLSFSYLTNAGKRINVPLKITGRLFSPKISPRYGKNRKSVLLFHRE